MSKNSINLIWDIFIHIVIMTIFNNFKFINIFNIAIEYVSSSLQPKKIKPANKRENIGIVTSKEFFNRNVKFLQRKHPD